MIALSWLHEAGIEAQLSPGTKSDLTVSDGDVSIPFSVKQRHRTPYPNELGSLTDRASTDGTRPLLVAPFIPPSLGTMLTSAGWSWIDADGNFDVRAPGLVLRQRRTSRPTATRERGERLPRGAGSFAIVRDLVRLDLDDPEGAGTTEIARRAQVSQPRVSQVLRQLQDLGLVERPSHRRWSPDREALLDRFLAEYPGPGGSEQHFYSLDGPVQAVLDIARAARSGTTPVAVSADVGPDLLRPWRRPTTVVVYAAQPIQLQVPGLVEAQGRHDANVILRAPDDRTLFRDPPLKASLQGTEIPLADETQLLWDLHDLGGADRLEAAGMLRSWLLESPR